MDGLWGSSLHLKSFDRLAIKIRFFCFLDDAIFVVCGDSFRMLEDLLAFLVLYMDVVEIWIQYP